MHLQGKDLNTPNTRDLQDNWKFPALMTCKQWIEIFYDIGGICLKRATGNKYSQRKILGETLEKLALLRVVFPKATQAECRTYLLNFDCTVAPYSNSQLHRAEALRGPRRKAIPTTADQAYTPHNIIKRDVY